MKHFRFSCSYYRCKMIRDSRWLRWALRLFIFSVIFPILYYVGIRIPICPTPQMAENLNSIILNLCSGYFVSYLTYYFSMAVPESVKKQHSRAILAENARLLNDSLYDFLNGLCEFRSDQNELFDENYYHLLNNYCHPLCTSYKMTEQNSLFIKEYEEKINSRQSSFIDNLEHLFSYERELLTNMEYSKMWQMMKQLRCSKYLYSFDNWRLFLNEILNYHRMTMQMNEYMKDERITYGNKTSFKERIRSNCLIISLVNIIHNH